jgi:hypothetical protein
MIPSGSLGQRMEVVPSDRGNMAHIRMGGLGLCRHPWFDLFKLFFINFWTFVIVANDAACKQEDQRQNSNHFRRKFENLFTLLPLAVGKIHA